MFGGFNTGNLIGTKTALLLLKVGIEAQFKKMGKKFKVTNYEVIYRGATDVIDFKIFDYPEAGKHELFKYNNGKVIANYFKNVVIPQKKITDTVDFITVNYEKMTMTVYTSKDGEKLQPKLFKI